MRWFNFFLILVCCLLTSTCSTKKNIQTNLNHELMIHDTLNIFQEVLQLRPHNDASLFGGSPRTPESNKGASLNNDASLFGGAPRTPRGGNQLYDTMGITQVKTQFVRGAAHQQRAQVNQDEKKDSVPAVEPDSGWAFFIPVLILIFSFFCVSVVIRLFISRP